jgi:hypothetical protein
MNRPRRVPLRFGSAAVLGIAFFCCEVGNLYGEPFQNLGFESATITSPGTVGSRPTSDALPYWTTSLGDQVAYDWTAMDSAAISVHDGLNYWGVWNDPNPLQGQYSISLQDGLEDDPRTPVGTWISQTGDIPSTARSLRFLSDTSTYIDELQVSINGAVIPFALYSTGNTVNPAWGSVNTYVCDISAFSGATNATLEFEKLVRDPANPAMHGIVDLDAIRFSSIVVPEPTTLALLTIAALVALAPIVRRRVVRE